ncbi:hypothetical protein ThrDRAFT_01185 [Frankia casuarinae]|uniref:UDP-N-acetylglucosamine kinase n=1 Tax=Frankia casuarinae (strain DSM 45818 / CECT 9043 / HFP020203 / CcI3) TaxID=106370 RepID=Q2JAG7_FRACC|nr:MULTISPECIES: zeta toxin family protein [Frankia]ABD11725.1 Zeta toxin [Frankia casuarinae]ETA03439.1 hypothetical protein CcI6DRAFT_01155 [Frankia sp. CcI6]EYT93215.1 hypothetical protein ThrDRAFT_01185 [Frankia casuarinae]OAA26796.1 Zeta toxin [Frankia casuarinae]OHV56281.1 hypothetical protein CgIS1_09195 [Frankia sp. CgIS1]
MASDVDRERYRLSEARNDQIFHDLIVPTEYAGRPRQAAPVVVFLAAQTGAGKTATALMVAQALDRRGGAIHIDLDVLKPYHPMYPSLMAADDTTAGAYTSIDGRRWMQKAQEWAIDHRIDVLMESAMRLPDEFEHPARRFAAAGYRVEVAFLAVPAALSRLGVLDRYWTQVAAHGYGRPIDPTIHDACFEAILREADAIDLRTVPVHTTSVFRRGNTSLYLNSREPDGLWRHPPRTAAAIHTERTRTWTPTETRRFAQAARRVHALARATVEKEMVEDVIDLARPLLAAPWTNSPLPATDLLPCLAGGTLAAGFPRPLQSIATARVRQESNQRMQPPSPPSPHQEGHPRR